MSKERMLFLIFLGLTVIMVTQIIEPAAAPEPGSVTSAEDAEGGYRTFQYIGLALFGLLTLVFLFRGFIRKTEAKSEEKAPGNQTGPSDQ